MGEYDVIVRSSFIQPQLDAPDIEVTSQVEFSLVVNPCTVSSFDVVSAPIGTITYVLGDPALPFGSYQFAQSPDCSYP